MVEALFRLAGISNFSFESVSDSFYSNAVAGSINGSKVFTIGMVSPAQLSAFDIKNDVFVSDVDWDAFLKASPQKNNAFKEVPKYPAVERDLALVVNKTIKYDAIKKGVEDLRLQKLQGINLFDVFESEKLGGDKKSMAVHFTFIDEEKTLTDKEIDSWMNKIISTLEKDLGAEIRK